MSDPSTPGRVAEPAAAYATDTTPSIDWIVARMVEAVAPSRIWLFGSRARGDHLPDSDVDLLVELPAAEGLDAVDRGRLVARAFPRRDWSLDVLVRTPAEFEDRRREPGFIEFEIARDGRVVYGSA